MPQTHGTRRSPHFDGEPLFENDPDRHIEDAFLAGCVLGTMKTTLEVEADRSAFPKLIGYFAFHARLPIAKA